MECSFLLLSLSGQGGALIKKSIANLLSLFLVLIAVFCSQLDDQAQANGFKSLSLQGAPPAVHSVSGVFAATSAQRVAASSDVDGCDHFFVFGQTSWECHHPIPVLLLSSLLLTQGVLPPGKMIESPCLPDRSFSREPFAPASYHLSPPDHPPRVS